MFHDAHFVDFFGIVDGAAVEDREFGSIESDKTVVDAGCIESGESMLNGADAHSVVANHCAAHCFYHIFSHGKNGGFAFKVNALEHITCVFGCRTKCGFYLQSGMKTLAINLE